MIQINKRVYEKARRFCDDNDERVKDFIEDAIERAILGESMQPIFKELKEIKDAIKKADIPTPKQPITDSCGRQKGKKQKNSPHRDNIPPNLHSHACYPCENFTYSEYHVGVGKCLAGHFGTSRPVECEDFRPVGGTTPKGKNFWHTANNAFTHKERQQFNRWLGTLYECVDTAFDFARSAAHMDDRPYSQEAFNQVRRLKDIVNKIPSLRG